MLGAQINNSSSWPSTLPAVWPALEDMHANTVEAPVYWEQMEPSPGKFDFSTVDLLVQQSRQHHMHLVVLWFGTWKNGNMHYVPQWVKADTKKYPRVINQAGEPIDVLSANSRSNLEADKHAFTALMHHLAEVDSNEHTVIFVQVENESGIVGSPAITRRIPTASSRAKCLPIFFVPPRSPQEHGVRCLAGRRMNSFKPITSPNTSTKLQRQGNTSSIFRSTAMCGSPIPWRSFQSGR